MIIQCHKKFIQIRLLSVSGCQPVTISKMSRKSENSAANSAGDGDPVLSPFDNSPRKTGLLH